MIVLSPACILAAFWMWLAACCCMVPAHAQELAPRAYSAAPVGTNFLAATYTRLLGDVLTDPSLFITDVHARINVCGAGYVRVFGLAGRTASIGFLVPYSSGDISGNVFDASNTAHPAGIGDVRVRLAMNLMGGPALTPDEFKMREPGTTLGASLTVVVPTGQYDPARLVNIGTNRWAFQPEIGLSEPIGNWFAELSAGAWFFGDNDAFLGGRRRAQSPLAVLQWHGGYQFLPAFWIAADLGFYTGGRMSINGISDADRQQNSRYGVTLSVPIVPRWVSQAGSIQGTHHPCRGRLQGHHADAPAPVDGPLM